MHRNSGPISAGGLLREPVDRIGLGGYLHLLEDFPDFISTIEDITKEFRLIKELHSKGNPYTAPIKVAVLTAWGHWRSWGYVGHFIPGVELYELTESLAGLPVDVSYISFNDILENGIPADIDVIINAGKIGTAWSGGEYWDNAQVVETITAWVANGGGFIGVGEPSATAFSGQYFQLSHLLGVDRETGLTSNNVKIGVKDQGEGHFILEDQNGELDLGNEINNIYALDKDTSVLKTKNGSVQLAVNGFFKGKSIYLSGFNFSSEITRLLLRSLYHASGKQNEFGAFVSSNVNTECTCFPESGKLVVINHSEKVQTTQVMDDQGSSYELSIQPLGIEILDLKQ